MIESKGLPLGIRIHRLHEFLSRDFGKQFRSPDDPRISKHDVQPAISFYHVVNNLLDFFFISSIKLSRMNIDARVQGFYLPLVYVEM